MQHESKKEVYAIKSCISILISFLVKIGLMVGRISYSSEKIFVFKVTFD